MKFSTKAIHSGQAPDKATGATIVPIYQTSTYTKESVDKHKGYEYTRNENPTRSALETCMADLENGKYGLSFASGLAAEHAIISVLNPGDHIVVLEDIYGGTYRLFEQVFKQKGYIFEYVNNDLTAFKNAITTKTKLVWIESPTNPLLKIVDINAVAEICKKNGALLVVDNTFATPFFQQPFHFGVDIIVHSTTKYMGGHSDVIGGAVITNNEGWYNKLKFMQKSVGGVSSPFDSWLTLRGLKTLAIRMKKHEENAFEVAGFLKSHKKVKEIYFPGLPDHPEYNLAKKQMTGFGGMVSFTLNGGFNEANNFLNKLRIFAIAESLGGIESLANYPAKMSHGSLPDDVKAKVGVTNNLIRLSVGIEDIDDLLYDLKQALM